MIIIEFVRYFTWNMRFMPHYVIGDDGYETTYGYIPR